MLVNFINPGVEVGIERHITRKFSVQLSGVLLTDLFNITPYENFRGYRLKPEVRYYVYEWEKISVFTALEVDIYQSNFEYNREYINSDFVRPTDPFPSYFELFEVEKRMFLLNPKVGIQLNLNRFVIEGAVNIGIKYRNTVHQEKETTIPENYRERPLYHLDIQNKAALEKQRTQPNVGMAFRVGWRF